jgi:magnesium chelatase family protein
MGTAHVWSVALAGIEGTPVTITARVGAPDPTAPTPADTTGLTTEMRERVRAAIRNSVLPWPTDQVTLSTSSPVSRVMSLWDLAVACVVLAADGQVPVDEVARVVLVGELALDGRVRPVRGVLPVLLAARDAGHEVAIVPTIMLPEAALVPGMRVFGADRLADVVAWLRGSRSYLSLPGPYRARPEDGRDAGSTVAEPDLADIVGQPDAIRALEVAAAGGHHLLLVGRPGADKTLCAQRLPDLLPPLTDEQALEVTAIHSLAGALASEFPLLRRPPLVAPHHTCSVPALVGGGAGVAKPGAISMAHRGVLLLDEAAEFGSSRLEALRTALDEGEVRIAGRDGVARYPARFQLVLATSPCPCGQAEQHCVCSSYAKRRYLSRLTGPLLDRIDLRVRLRPPSRTREQSTSDKTVEVRVRVAQARQRAGQRWAPHGARTNAEVAAMVLTHGDFGLPRTVTAPVDDALARGAVTGTGATRALRVAWTLADLDGLERPGVDQIVEALEFRDRRPM